MKKKSVMTIMFMFSAMILMGQVKDSTSNLFFNSADRLLQTSGKLKIGGYGGVHYNQALSQSTFSNGKMDVHRFIMMMGYQFNARTQFITELEFEHVKEIYVEQAFLQYKLTDFMDLRAGLLLTPMGIVNEYHEPVFFNGVERPLIDKNIVPTTWREIGIGISGLILPVSMKYQAYLMNGFNGFDGEANMGGASGLRSGRQKGAESFINSPNLAVKVEYFGIGGLNLGLSEYLGKTESTVYHGLSKSDNAGLASADSSVVTIAMTGADARYNYRGFKMAAQLYYTAIGNTEKFNEYTADKNGGDLGSSMYGYYIDLSYNLLKNTSYDLKLFPFIRYSNYDTHHSVVNITDNEAYKKSVITTGLTFYLAEGALLKADMQFIKDGSSAKYASTFNAGFGIVF